MENTKYCTSCKTIFPRTSKYFHKNNFREDGLHLLCKECQKKYTRIYTHKKRGYINEKANLKYWLKTKKITQKQHDDSVVILKKIYNVK